jgi:hypothetical protein
MGQVRYIEKKFNRKTECRNPFGRPRRRWECNVKMDLEDVRFEVVDCISNGLR